MRSKVYILSSVQEQSKIGECMQFKKLLPLLVLFALLAVPVLAAPFDSVKGILTSVQDLIGSGLDGISKNPGVWMKVILIILLFTILYTQAVKHIIKDENKRSARITFSLVLAIAMVAPIPSQFIDVLFKELAVVGVIIYILLVFCLWYFARSFTTSGERGGYAFAFIFWLVAVGLINGIASQVDIQSLKDTSGYLSLFALVCLFYYGYKVISPGNEPHEGAIAAGSAAKSSGWLPGTKEWKDSSAKNASAREQAEFDALKKAVPAAINRLPNLHRAVLTVIAHEKMPQMDKGKKLGKKDEPIYSNAVISERDFQGIQALVSDVLRYLAQVQQFKSGLARLNPQTLDQFNKDIEMTKGLLKINHKGLLANHEEANWVNMLYTLFHEKNGRILAELQTFQAALASH